MSFVFISHANRDKPRLRPILDALIQDGFKLWLDNPEAAGYSSEEARVFYRIRAGERWEDEIDEALRNAACVLVLWSDAAKEERRVWLKEAVFADVARTMVACCIDATPPTELRPEFQKHQTPRLDPDHAGFADTYVVVRDAIRRKLETAVQPDARALQRQLADALQALLARGDGELRTGLEAAAARPQAVKSRRAIELPLLADRVDQASLFNDALSDAAGLGGAYPVMLKGAGNELPERFIERMRVETAALDASRDGWTQERIDWPKEAETQAQFVSAYRSHLWRKFSLTLQGASGRGEDARDARDRRIAEHLEGLGLTVLLHVVHAREWKRDEPARIAWWRDYWASLSALGPRIKVTPLLLVPMKEAVPGYKDCPGGRSPGGRVGHRDIWKAARSLTHVQVLPLLRPIQQGDADNWLCDHADAFNENHRSALEKALERLFRSGRARKHGVAHRDFHAALKDLCAQAG